MPCLEQQASNDQPERSLLCSQPSKDTCQLGATSEVDLLRRGRRRYHRHRNPLPYPGVRFRLAPGRRQFGCFRGDLPDKLGTRGPVYRRTL